MIVAWRLKQAVGSRMMPDCTQFKFVACHDLEACWQHLLGLESFDLSQVDFEMENCREILLWVAPLFERNDNEHLYKAHAVLTAFRTLASPEKLLYREGDLPDGWKYTLPPDKLRPTMENQEMKLGKLRGDREMKQKELQAAIEWLKMVTFPGPLNWTFEVSKLCLADAFNLLSEIQSRWATRLGSYFVRSWLKKWFALSWVVGHALHGPASLPGCGGQWSSWRRGVLEFKKLRNQL